MVSFQVLDALKSNPDITSQLIQQNRIQSSMNPNNQMVINNQPPMNNHGMNTMNNHAMNQSMQMNSESYFYTPLNCDKRSRDISDSTNVMVIL